MPPATTADPRREEAIEATVWFSILARARAIGDIEEAYDALKELENLGVRVRFFRPRGKAVAHAR